MSAPSKSKKRGAFETPPPPTTLFVAKNGVRIYIRTPDGETPVGQPVAYMDNEHVARNVADADEIVRRWNAHGDLLAACENARAWIDDHAHDPRSARVVALISFLGAAIAKATDSNTSAKRSFDDAVGRGVKP